MNFKLKSFCFLYRKHLLLIIMRAFVFLFSVVLFALSPENVISQNSKIKIDQDKNITVDEIFDLIKKQTDYNFFYEEGLFKDFPLVKVKKGIIKTNKLLKRSLSSSNFEIILTNDNDFLIKEVSSSSVIIGDKQQSITGRVTDVNGNPLPGANILEKGTSNGAQTDFDGEYSIEVANMNTVLIVSYIGFATKEVEVNNQNTINIILQEDAASLDEVVIVGYGTQKKVNLTGSVSVVSTDDLASRPITSLSSGLSGLAPGIQVTQASGGRIGENDASIRIRGIGTLNNSNPLVLVDGVSSSMNDINPDDVESISVLKDAASAAIYGSRAANGVILITTKKGKKGILRVNYDGYAGWQQATKKQGFVSDFATWMELANENKTNGGQGEIFDQSDIDEWRNSNNPLTHPNVDWYERQVGRKAFIQSHSLSVSGGSDNTTYRFSLGYLNQDGLQKPNNQKRYHVRAQVESEILKGLKIGTNLFYRWTDLNPTVNSSNGGGVDFNVVPAIPDFKGPNGLWGGSQHSSVGIVFNPFWNNEVLHNESRRQRFLGSAYLNWEILPDLVFKTNISLNSNTRFDTSFNETSTSWNFREDSPARIRDINSGRSRHLQDYLVTNFYTLDYKKSFGNHNLSLLAGYQSEIFREDDVLASVENFPGNAIRVIDAGLSNPGVSGSLSEWAIQSYFGRLNYDFKGKYLFEANMRADGSSRFREGKKWGVFPSFSVGWRISEEEFMKDNPTINNLKLRASWGELGNQLIGEYPYQATYNLNQNYSFGGSVVSGIAQNSLANADITWETTTTVNVGLDAGLLNNKLNFTFEYFKRTTDGILFEQQIPRFLGNKSAPTVNLAEVINDGWEVSANYNGKLGDDLYFSIGGNVTKLRNKVSRFFGDTFSGGTFIIQEGQPFRAIRGLEAIGIFQNQSEIDNAPTHPGAVAPGDIQYKDQLTVDTNGDGIPDEADGVIDSNDRTVIGNTIPKFVYGANINLNYKNLDLGIILQGVSDVDTYAGGGFAFQAFNQDDRGLVSDFWLNRWTPQNPTNEVPRLVSASSYNGNRQVSSFWVNDISYLRVKNIQVGYTLPSSLIDKYGFNKARLYLSADNVFTFTNWKWDYDPERGQTAQTPGLPNLATFVVGLNLQF